MAIPKSKAHLLNPTPVGPPPRPVSRSKAQPPCRPPPPPPPPEWVATFKRPRRWFASPSAGVLLVVFFALLYLPGLLVMPPVDRDESRFAQASRQMLEGIVDPKQGSDPAGSLLIPRVQDRPRLNKPPLIYWLQSISAGSVTLGSPARDAIWMYRLPSFLAAIGTVLLVWRVGASMFDPRAGFLAALLLGVGPAFAWEANQARADQVLVFCVVLSISGLWAFWKRRRRPGGKGLGPWAALWGGLALGLLTKGPVAIMIVGLTIVPLSLLDRSPYWLRRTRPVIGLLCAIVPVGLWAFFAASHVGHDTYWSAMLAETLGRSASAKEGHWGPPGYHLLLVSVLFWPGSLMLAWGAARAFRIGLPPPAGAKRSLPRFPTWRDRVAQGWSRVRSARAGRSAECFLLAWAVPSWVAFELIATKLPHYVLPLYPALALLAARAVLAAAAPRRRTGASRLSAGAWTALGGSLVLGVGALAVMGRLFGDVASVLLGVLALVIVAGAAWLIARAATLLARAFLVEAQVFGVGAAALTLLALTALTAPAFLGLSPSVAASVRRADPEGARVLGSIGYHEDSLVFLTRGRLIRVSDADAEAWLEEHPEALVLMTKGMADKHKESRRSLGFFMGFNYSRGRAEWLTLTEPIRER